jgi:protein-S-isoprenylcysteine O-methyltransferase Ste14
MSPAEAGSNAGNFASPDRTTATLVRFGHFLFKRRKFVFPLMSLGILLVGRPRMFLGKESWDRALDVLGIAVAVAGQTLRAMVIGLAYIKRGGEDGSIDAPSLVVEGLFAHCRNPLYVGNMLEFTGLTLILNSPVGYLIGLPFFALAYYSITLAEEGFLRGKFGASFDDYCRRVNRFVPSFRGLQLTLSGMSFNWKRVIRKEYGTTFVWLTTLLALLAWQSYIFHGWPAAQSTVRHLLMLWVPVLLYYIAARTLKKSGRLGRT